MTDNSSAHRVVAAAADMIFAARIRGVAEQQGVPVQMVRSAAALLDAVAAADLVLLDLETRWVDASLIARIKADGAASGVRVVAFVSHVRTDLIEEARAAGADRVMARSAFVKDLPALLRGG